MIEAWNNYKKTLRFESEIAKGRRYCKCGHSMVFSKTGRSNKKICNYCGRIVYRSDIEEFKERLINCIKKGGN